MNDANSLNPKQEASHKLEFKVHTEMLHVPMDVISSKNSDAVTACSSADDVIKLIHQLLALNALSNQFLTSGWPLPIQSPRAAIQEANIPASKVLT